MVLYYELQELTTIKTKLKLFTGLSHFLRYKLNAVKSQYILRPLLTRLQFCMTQFLRWRYALTRKHYAAIGYRFKAIAESCIDFKYA